MTHVVAERLQADCCSPDPDVALEATRLIEEARSWLADCQWLNMEPEDFDTLGTLAIVRGVERFYEGGWTAFVRATV